MGTAYCAEGGGARSVNGPRRQAGWEQPALPKANEKRPCLVGKPLLVRGDFHIVQVPAFQEVEPVGEEVELELDLPANGVAHEPHAAQATGQHAEDLRLGSSPDDADLRHARDVAARADLVIVATLAASVQRMQARLVEAVLSTGTPTITVAMRTPYDLAAYPASRTHLCSYAIVPAAVEAVADALVGRVPITGRLPVAIPGLYPRGHGMEVR